MGEAVVSSENIQIPQTEVGKEIGQPPGETKNQKKEIAVAGSAAAAGTSSSSFAVVQWERFLRKMAVRVLLVEADDSTRQIIAALLRKCSYKVAAVPDGLKAWEVLKGRSHNFDLILTEVELPSISGYALLTLIMEHEVCKNIPVIMMSSQDSVSTVYKCMLGGAADFLVKPLRKNELRNLWQHVWRKQASRSGVGLGPPDESVQQKIEATAENNALSNHSNDSMACVPGNMECNEKGSDAQSSCTKPELETDAAAAVELVPSLAQPKAPKCLSHDLNIYAQEDCYQESRKTQANDDKEVGETQVLFSIDANYGTTQGQRKKFDEQGNVVGQIPESNHILDYSCREAIDLIGNFDNNMKGTLESPASNASTNRFDILARLDLSLRRSHPCSSVNQVNDESRRLNHSDASAFSRYINKPLQVRNSTSPSTCNQQNDHETNSEKQLSSHAPDYNSDAQGPFQAGLQETAFPYPQQREISQPVPVRGLSFENVINGFGPVMPQLYRAPPGLSPLLSPGVASNSPHFTQLSPFKPLERQLSTTQNFHNLLDHRKNGQNLDNLEDYPQVSCANDQTANTSFYNAHHQSIGSGSNCNSLVQAIPECGNEEGLNVHEGASDRSIQRQVALSKFRMKRKDRCFEKKVRYESRKKLAEQRPRVKGQFVRQVPNDPQPGSSPTT